MSSDSDLDGFTDLMELKFGTNPVQDTTLMHDSDRDGLVDSEEIVLGTNPFAVEDAALRYLYQPLVEIESSTEFVRCFEFKIENVRLVRTAATATQRAGENQICMYMAQVSSEDGSAVPTVTRACKTVRYLPEANLKEPATGRLTFAASDFLPYVNCEE